MHKLGLQAVQAKSYKRTHQARQPYRDTIKSNVLGREFSANRPNRKWVCDITYIALRQGWLYLSIVMDLYSRAIVGWSMGCRPSKGLVSRALAMAFEMRRPKPGLVLHSDQGVQYSSRSYLQEAESYGFIVSMSRRGNCYDNAVAESFFHTLKAELVRNRVFSTASEAKQTLFKYIEIFYNRQRLHSTIGYQPPLEYEALGVA